MKKLFFLATFVVCIALSVSVALSDDASEFYGIGTLSVVEPGQPVGYGIIGLDFDQVTRSLPSFRTSLGRLNDIAPLDRKMLTSLFAVPEQAISTIVEIIFERTGCLGTCPAYKVRLNRNGRATYFGKAYVKKIGAHTGVVYHWQFQKISELLYILDFFQLQSQYRSEISCGSTAILAARRNGKWYKVSNYNSAGPIILWGLEMTIDALIEKIDWKKTNSLDGEKEKTIN